MKKYEAMFVIKPDLSEKDRKDLFSQLNDTVVKNKGSILQEGIWSEKRKFYFTIKKHQEGAYYLMGFSVTEPSAIKELERAYKLNENILRVLITKLA